MGCWCGVQLPKGGLFIESFDSMTHIWPTLISFHRAFVNWSVVFDCTMVDGSRFQQQIVLGKKLYLLLSVLALMLINVWLCPLDQLPDGLMCGGIDTAT